MKCCRHLLSRDFSIYSSYIIYFMVSLLDKCCRCVDCHKQTYMYSRQKEAERKKIYRKNSLISLKSFFLLLFFLSFSIALFLMIMISSQLVIFVKFLSSSSAASLLFASFFGLLPSSGKRYYECITLLFTRTRR